MCTGFIWFNIGAVAGSFLHDNEPLGSISEGNIFEELSNFLASQRGLCFTYS